MEDWVVKMKGKASTCVNKSCFSIIKIELSHFVVDKILLLYFFNYWNWSNIFITEKITESSPKTGQFGHEIFREKICLFFGRLNISKIWT